MDMVVKRPYLKYAAALVLILKHDIDDPSAVTTRDEMWKTARSLDSYSMFMPQQGCIGWMGLGGKLI